MSERQFTGKTGDVWTWEETPETVEALKKLHESSAKVPPEVKFWGNYQGPLYAPHPDLRKKVKNKD